MAQQPKKAVSKADEPKVRLVLLCTVHHDQDVFDEGEEAEFPASAAERLVASGAARPAETPAAQFLGWAARLQEIGVSIAHASYHKHSAYVLANADMPGFSRRDQALLALLVLGHRGRLDRLQQPRAAPEWLLIFCLRLAALLHRARDDAPPPEVGAGITAAGFELLLEREWLDGAPLTAATLAEEVEQWAAVGIEFRVRTRRRLMGRGAPA